MGPITKGTGLLVGAAVLAGAVGACTTRGAASGDGGPAASCVATLKFRGLVYGETSLRTHPPYKTVGRVPPARMHEIGIGVFPPCNDTNRSSDLPQEVQVAGIDDVSPRIAVAVFPYGSVFVRSGAAIPGSLTAAPWIQWVESD